MAATERPAEEFYDSEADPWEVVNLIDAPEHQQRIAAMRQQLDAWRISLIDCRVVRRRCWGSIFVRVSVDTCLSAVMIVCQPANIYSS